jgi:predicted ATPase
LFDRRPNWAQGAPRVHLQPLSPQQSRKLVDEILQKVKRVPEPLRELVVNNSEGNPFYMEELVKMLIEDGVIVKNPGDMEGQWEVDWTGWPVARPHPCGCAPGAFRQPVPG